MNITEAQKEVEAQYPGAGEPREEHGAYRWDINNTVIHWLPKESPERQWMWESYAGHGRASTLAWARWKGIADRGI
jgi:hypothetical protein